MRKSTKFFILILSALFIFAFFFVIYYKSESGDGSEILLPWEMQIGLSGLDYIIYYLSILQGFFSDYPWVV